MSKAEEVTKSNEAAKSDEVTKDANESEIEIQEIPFEKIELQTVPYDNTQEEAQEERRYEEVQLSK